MNTRPLVSVVLPTYNRAHLLQRAIGSVLGQTHKNLELLVVDDCSNDTTPDVITAIGDSRLKYIHNQTRLGVSNSRNVGVQNASADLVAFIDSDDEWLVQKLEKQVAVLEQQSSDIAIIMCGSLHRNDPSNSSPFAASREYLIDITDSVPYGIPQTQSWLARREALVAAGLFDPTIGCFEDFDLALRVTQQWRVLLINEPLWIFQSTPGSLFSDLNNRAVGLQAIYEKNRQRFVSDRKLDSTTLTQIGQFHMAARNRSVGIQWLVRAISVDPLNLRAWANLCASLTGNTGFAAYLRVAQRLRARWFPGRPTPLPINSERNK